MTTEYKSQFLFFKKRGTILGLVTTRIMAKLSVIFGNHGKTFPEFSGNLVGSRAPKAARLHLESGKTYVKSAPANGRNVWPKQPILGDSRVPFVKKIGSPSSFG